MASNPQVHGGVAGVPHKDDRFSGTGYSGPPEDRPSIVRITVAVACAPLAPSPDATELRSRFRAFLTWEPIMTLFSDITAIGTADAWRSLTGSGSLMLEAAMMAEGQEEVAIASCRPLPWLRARSAVCGIQAPHRAADYRG